MWVVVLGFVLLAGLVISKCTRRAERPIDNVWISLAHGFAPPRPPTASCLAVESVLAALPRLVRQRDVVRACAALPRVSMRAALRASAEPTLLAERAHLAYSFVAYAHAREEPDAPLPRAVHEPWASACAFLGRDVQFDYIACVLLNCDVQRGRVAATFTGDVQEEGFYLLHARVEHAASPMINAVYVASQSPVGLADVVAAMRSSVKALRAMTGLLAQMHSICTPAFFGACLRKHLGPTTAWLDVGTLRRPRRVAWPGASGAQSYVLTLVDAFLGGGVHVPKNVPRTHARVLSRVSRRAAASLPSLCELGATDCSDRVALTRAVAAFRLAHVRLVRCYLSDGTGTGGTTHADFLTRHVHKE